MLWKARKGVGIEGNGSNNLTALPSHLFNYFIFLHPLFPFNVSSSLSQPIISTKRLSISKLTVKY